MLPATRSGSVRLTEIAIMPGGIGRFEVASAIVLPNWAARICWPAKIGMDAILPFSASVVTTAFAPTSFFGAVDITIWPEARASSYLVPAATSVVALSTLTFSNLSPARLSAPWT